MTQIDKTLLAKNYYQDAQGTMFCFENRRGECVWLDRNHLDNISNMFKSGKASVLYGAKPSHSKKLVKDICYTKSLGLALIVNGAGDQVYLTQDIIATVEHMSGLNRVEEARLVQ